MKTHYEASSNHKNSLLRIAGSGATAARACMGRLRESSTRDGGAWNFRQRAEALGASTSMKRASDELAIIPRRRSRSVGDKFRRRVKTSYFPSFLYCTYRRFTTWHSPEFRPTSAQISLRSFVPNAPKFRPYFIEMRSTTQRGNFMCNRRGRHASYIPTYLLTVLTDLSY